MKHLLTVEHLHVSFKNDRKQNNEVVSDLSFVVDPGEILAIVGESGCGKSASAMAIMGLLGRSGQVTGGSVYFEGADLLKLSDRELDQVRGVSMSMIFQDSLTGLNPVFRVGRQICESMRIHLGLSKEESLERCAQLLVKVGLDQPELIMKKFPHQLSGGQRQRVMIAMALSTGPKLLIADEPTTALDVTIQAQIMAMIRDLVSEMHMAMILITHDLGLVAEMADRVAVMYAGQIIETADVYSLFEQRKHPYTRALISAVPGIDDRAVERLVSIDGAVPENYGSLEGCRFYSRCPEKVHCPYFTTDADQKPGQGPALGNGSELTLPDYDPEGAPDYYVRCLLAGEGYHGK